MYETEEFEDHAPHCANCHEEIDGVYVFSTCSKCGDTDDTESGEWLSEGEDEAWRVELFDDHAYNDPAFFCKDCLSTAEDKYEGIEDANVGSALCDLCGGELFDLGRLGNRQHQRCRNCGAEGSYVIQTEAELEENGQPRLDLPLEYKAPLKSEEQAADQNPYPGDLTAEG
jgi:hypothetical protein